MLWSTFYEVDGTYAILIYHLSKLSTLDELFFPFLPSLSLSVFAIIVLT